VQLAVVALHYRCPILGGAHGLVAKGLQGVDLFGEGLWVFMVEFRNVLECNEGHFNCLLLIKVCSNSLVKILILILVTFQAYFKMPIKMVDLD